MKVFISWSGNYSREIAIFLKGWLQQVLQSSNPWVSDQDIHSGSRWFIELSNNLDSTSVGIICLTKDNIEKPWIMFEAGALAKDMERSMVCSFLIDLKSEDIPATNPLSQFQHTVPTKESILHLIRTINNYSDKKLEENILEKIFQVYWSIFETKYSEILATMKNEEKKREEKKGSKDTLSAESVDVLTEVSNMLKNLDRRMYLLEKRIEQEKSENRDRKDDLTDSIDKLLKQNYPSRSYLTTPSTDENIPLIKYAIKKKIDLDDK